MRRALRVRGSRSQGSGCSAASSAIAGGGPGDEGEADQPVAGAGLLDVVAEPGEGFGELGDGAPDVRVGRVAGEGGRGPQGEADAQPARITAGRAGGVDGGRAVRVTGVRSRSGVQEEGGVRDRTGQGAVDREALEGVAVRVDGDPAALRLDADEVGPGCGDTDGARTVGTQCGGDEPCRDRRGGAPGGTARGVRGVPGVAGGAEGAPFREGPLSQLAGVGLADDDGPGGPEPADGLAVGGGGRQRAVAAEVGGQAYHVGVVLDRHRDPEQREPLPRREPPVGVRGLGERGLVTQLTEGVEALMARLDARERPGDQRGGGRPALGELPGAVHEPWLYGRLHRPEGPGPLRGVC